MSFNDVDHIKVFIDLLLLDLKCIQRELSQKQVVVHQQQRGVFVKE